MSSWNVDIKLMVKQLDKDFGWSERYPEWILFGLSVVALSFLVVDPFNVF